MRCGGLGALMSDVCKLEPRRDGTEHGMLGAVGIAENAMQLSQGVAGIRIAVRGKLGERRTPVRRGDAQTLQIAMTDLQCGAVQVQPGGSM